MSILEILNETTLIKLIFVAIIYSAISIASCGGIVFFIFLKYIRNTYKIAKEFRDQLKKEENELIDLSFKIADCSERFAAGHDQLQLIYTSRKEVEIITIQNSNLYL